ncbi:MAG: hypothetical protein JXR40_00210 [Pontiellaceae bacterium]|nr:hypothetical protein [Pontiellaceae bacterium]
MGGAKTEYPADPASSLRKQWYQELQDKCYLPSRILESASFNKAIKKGAANPFECGKNISILKPLIEKRGTLTVRLFTVSALEAEDHILFGGVTDDGLELDQEQCRRLFDLSGNLTTESPETQRRTKKDFGLCASVNSSEAGVEKEIRVDQCIVVVESLQNKLLGEISERNAVFFDEEMEKLEKWADDVKKSLEIQLKQMDADIKTLKSDSRKIPDLQRKVEAQRRIKKMENRRNQLRQNLFVEQDQIDEKKESLLETVEAKMEQSVREELVLEIEWHLV